MKIAFIGTHGVGKTALCYDVAGFLQRKGIHVELVLETAREAYSAGFKLNEGTSKEAQEWILFRQIQKEIEALNRIKENNKKALVVCDRSLLDNYVYYVNKFGRNKELEELIKEKIKGYDFLFIVPIFYSEDEIQEDSVRSTNKEFQIAIAGLVEELIRDFKVNTVRLPLPNTDEDSKNNRLWVEFVFEKINAKL